MHKKHKSRQEKNKQTYLLIEDTTSDVAFEAYGKTLNELFENSAKALFSIVCDIKHVEPKIKKDFHLKSDSIKQLLISWLESLLASVDIDGMFYSDFNVNININNNTIDAVALGEEASSEKSGTVVKGITYHDFSIKKIDKGYKGYKAKVVCDI